MNPRRHTTRYIIIKIVNLKIKCEKKKYVEASVINYIQSSKERVETKCHYYDLCGGCNIMHMSYNEQLKFKYEKIKNIVLLKAWSYTLGG